MAVKVLDYPLDALAFNYVSFGFFALVNNLWTWVAVVTAAVSFWRIRIRAAASAGAVLSPLKSEPPELHDRETDASSAPSTLKEDPAPSTVPAVVAAGGGGVTKGKFTVYYENDRKSDGEVALAGPWAASDCDVDGDCGEWSQWWEGVMKTRMGELGWYSCQDRTVLNGSVVRFWDGSGRRRSVTGGLLL